ncbi:CCA tRNA nucleotidyltransferase [Limosilactobacillus caviae]|uniref:CCA-adding enzyme n=1 Tax=Limosilactobacillus caviae TaxID=1769424 RepID=A0ABQ2C3E9_9LACO|nr:CCA tRNA nucleotidyltransferase [Limosilactobacillus caviae]MCD7124622.1 CCA tRNA nucleotidyltransferase [Limosilactobacillus caviae]MRH45893.1 CCA tRNA nucleotidyltransferase [Limosilactobacillus reuteri]GGI62928.1 CCA-adding enzyme [Limosilactobacillus caviae]
MKIKQLPAIFEPARPVLQKIEAAGYEAYFVGGCVRDTILHDEIHDIDIATSAYPSEIKAIFNHTVDTGIEHGTVMILDHGTGYETTTFRTESGYQDFRRPDKVTFVRSLNEDLQRRDFTINALALREDGEVIDLFNGLADLQKRLIRAVGDPNERFHEDALRMMRAVRFASKLDFVIDVPTLKGIKENAPLLAKIAVERIRVELEKLFLGQNPVAGLKDFIATGLYQYCPGLANTKDQLATLLVLNQWHLENEAQVWAVLGLQLQLDQSEIAKFLKKWKTANDLIAQVKKIIPAVNAIHQRNLTPSLMFRTGDSALHDANQVAKLYGWAIEDSELQKAYQRLPIKSAKDLAIDGKMLITKAGIKPGPVMGKIIQQLTLLVLNDEVANDTTTLLNKAQELVKEG